MTKKALFILFMGGSIILSSCVSKQKYMESQEALASCTKERKALQSKAMGLETSNNELSADKAQMAEKIKKLSADTLSYSRRYNDLSQRYETLRQSFNDLTESCRYPSG